MNGTASLACMCCYRNRHRPERTVRVSVYGQARAQVVMAREVAGLRGAGGEVAANAKCGGRRWLGTGGYWGGATIGKACAGRRRKVGGRWCRNGGRREGGSQAGKRQYE